MPYSLLQESIEQWTNVFGLSQTPTSSDTPQTNWNRRRYADQTQTFTNLVSAYESDYGVCRVVLGKRAKKLATDSTPNDTFGTAGKVRTDFAGDEDVARDVVIQPDQKIVVAGSREFQGNPAFALARTESRFSALAPLRSATSRRWMRTAI